jgi:nitrous oxide reductase accessory protein NosL
MSRVSKYAFKTIDDALRFTNKYGGKVVDFKTALDIASKDFK